MCTVQSLIFFKDCTVSFYYFNETFFVGFKGVLWVGADYNHDDRKFEWISGEELPKSSSSWAPNQPQNNDEYCVALDKDYKLHDYPCSHDLNYLCENPPI